MLLALARAGGALLGTPEVEKRISSNRSSRGAAATVSFRLAGWIGASFESGGKPLPAGAGAIVEFVKGKGWRLKVKSEVK